jgi:hypothetical protein
MSDSADDAASNITNDLRDLFKQFAQPVIDSLDTRLRDQIDKRVDDRVDATIDDKLADRLSVLERALADVDRAVRALQARLDATP